MNAFNSLNWLPAVSYHIPSWLLLKKDKVKMRQSALACVLLVEKNGDIKICKQ